MLILAVDDETLMLNMLVETLKNVFSDERYVVMGFDDGKQALEYVSSSEESLPYAFLDIRLRGMLGIELAKEVKEIRSETRIIFCSAYTEYALDAFSVHAVGYLLKPITKAKIQETLDQIDMMLTRSRNARSWWFRHLDILRLFSMISLFLGSGPRQKNC